jgi:hypothetical protein
LSHVIGHPYYALAPRRMTWAELEREGSALWGVAWAAEFMRLARVGARTMRRWQRTGEVTSGPVTAMMVALRTEKRFLGIVSTEQT